ncbi:MAG: hypothetical protein HYW65_03585 [Candidatus Liptonbacteria bacterium]|nr:hypothetical protein [Candidatus Liptonbacteria bacterium]
MTFIKPHNKKSILTIVLVCMIFGMVAGASSLVVAYNRFINVERSVSAFASRLQQQEARNAKLKSELLTLFDAAHLTAFAESRSLIREKHPAYLTVDAQWHLASGQ